MVEHILGKNEIQVQFLVGAPLDKHTDWIYNRDMYKVEYKDARGRACVEEVETLSLAMNRSKEIGLFVKINGDNFELVGVFGSDSVKEGKLPDGTDYTWFKRRRP